MDDSRIIQVEIVQGDIEHRLPLGEFTGRLVAAMTDVSFRSKLFSTKGTVDRADLERGITSAVDRVIQDIRDGGRR